MIDIDESAVDITFNPPVESTFAQPKTADVTNGVSCGASFSENQTVDETVLDKTAPISEDETGNVDYCINLFGELINNAI